MRSNEYLRRKISCYQNGNPPLVSQMHDRHNYKIHIPYLRERNTHIILRQIKKSSSEERSK